MNIQEIEMNLEKYTNEKNIHSIENIEMTKENFVKEILSIIMLWDRDVFLKCAYPNALDCFYWALVITFQISVAVFSTTGVVS